MGLGEDRISVLSEPLLHHILSFLPTKYVVSTSTLSKRWRYVWVTIPVLDFRQWARCALPTSLEVERFMNFVDRMLFLHRMTKTAIQKFYIDCDYVKGLDASRVNEWIANVLRHRVEELIIRYSSFEFPSCFSTYESLTMLELDAYEILLPPESISFPRVKVLRLRNIGFDDRLAQQFFSNCHVLEELVLSECKWKDIVVLCISAPALKRLFIIGPHSIHKGRLENCGLNVYAPSLQSFQYIDSVAKYFDLHRLPSLVDAEIDFQFYIRDTGEEIEEMSEMGIRATKLLQNLSNVKLLKLSRNTFEALSFAYGLVTKLPTFHNLTHLQVSSELLCSRTIFDLLQITPNLESLVFVQGICIGQTNDDDGWTLNVVPQCLLKNLKSVEFRNFRYSSGLNVVKLFLKSAGSLQRMTIVSPSYLSTYRKNEVMKQLLTFPRGSPSCVVDFS